MQRGFAPILIVIAVLVASVVGAGGYYLYQQQKIKNINNFEECIKAGNPVLESDPRQCSTKDGKHFVEELSEGEKEKLKPPVIDETIDWKTYSNEYASVKFRIKYPDGWSYSVAGEGKLLVSFYPNHPSNIAPRDTDDPLSSIQINVELSDGLLCLSEPENSCADIVVDSLPGKRYQRKSYYEIVAVQKDNTSFQLRAPKLNKEIFYEGKYPKDREYYSFYDLLPESERTRIFDTMLSTLKFLK